MIHLIVAGFLVVLGFFIKAKRLSGLIAGYNTSTREAKAEYDEKALCTGTGNFLYGLAGTLLLSSLGELLGIRMFISLGWGLFVLLTIGFVIYANTGRRFMK